MICGVLIADGGLDFWNYWTGPGSVAGELALVFGVVFLVVLLVFVWATFWRRPRRHHSHHHTPASTGTPVVGLPQRRRRIPRLLRIVRRHRHRRRHRPAN